MLNIFPKRQASGNLTETTLFDQTNFYLAFEKDLGNCLYEAIIESPFITQRRLGLLLPAIQKLKDRKARVVVNTRDPQDNDDQYMHDESIRAIAALQRIGV